MVTISGWERFRKAVTGSYSEKLTFALAEEKARIHFEAVAAEKARLEAAAKAKADREAKEAEAAKKAAAAKKAPVQPKKATPPRSSEKKTAAPKKATRPATKTVSKPNPKDEYKRPAKLKADARDGDGDGLVQDGTIHERRVAPKKKAPAKKPSTTSTKKKSS